MPRGQHWQQTRTEAERLRKEVTANSAGGAAESATTGTAVEERYPWVKTVYQLIHKSQTTRALRIIYASVEAHFVNGDLKGLADILANVDLGRLDAVTMTGLLRISGRAKNAIPSWIVLLRKVRSELEREQVPDLPGLLIGLTE